MTAIKTDQLHIRIEPALKKKFEAAAKKDNRTVASAVIDAITEYIKKVNEKKS